MFFPDIFREFRQQSSLAARIFSRLEIVTVFTVFIFTDRFAVRAGVYPDETLVIPHDYISVVQHHLAAPSAIFT